MTPEDIQQWIAAYRSSSNAKTLTNRLYYLRSFYNFCVENGYLNRNPVLRKGEGVTEKYWVVNRRLGNDENRAAVNEYLLSLKVANYSYQTITKYRDILQRFLKNQKEVFSNITTVEIREWLDQHEIGLKEKTISLHLSILNSFYAFYVEEGVIEKSPMKSRWFPRLPKPVPKYLDKEEVAKVRQQGEKECLRNRVILEFLLSSGSRIGEVHGINRKDVDLENRTALVCGKGNKIRQVHFSDKCALLMERYFASRNDRDPALFVTTIGKARRLCKPRMRVILKRMGKGAELSGSLYPHRLRHTFATVLLAKGADFSFIADQLGHSDLKTTQTYAHLPNGEIISMYRKYMG